MDKLEIIKSIEEIEQKLTRLQLTMKLLATHTNVIEVFTLDELNSLNISSTERKNIACIHPLNQTILIK